MPQNTAVDERDNLSKSFKTSEMLRFWSTVLSGSYDVWGGTHATKHLKTKENQHHVHLLTHWDAWNNVFCPTGKETLLLTDSSRPVIFKESQQCKVRDPRIWFINNFSYECNWTLNNKSEALRTKQRIITNWLGYQDSWGGEIITYVDLGSVIAGHINLKSHAVLLNKVWI